MTNQTAHFDAAYAAFRDALAHVLTTDVRAFSRNADVGRSRLRAHIACVCARTALAQACSALREPTNGRRTKCNTW